MIGSIRSSRIRRTPFVPSSKSLVVQASNSRGGQAVETLVPLRSFAHPFFGRLCRMFSLNALH
ncbi:hypothetical protein [Nitrosomonas sp. Nm33]|uniref:hypothetical protein n=1 Tax=Nitrosomonas sp. Nm33 TaxID=133724 RepID=UPI00115FA836|nr:hypothetical protein [Nitrosomonas sp. Nm33]